MERSILTFYSHDDQLHGQKALLQRIETQDWSDADFVAKTDPLIVGWDVYDCYEDSVYGQKTETKFVVHHIACCHHTVPSTFIQTLYRVHPQGFTKQDSHYRRLPIHLGCMAGASTESLMEIIKVTNSLSPTLPAEDSVPLLMMKDVAGRIPLHYACKHLHLRDVIQELIVLYAESAKVADVNGFLPIHVACRFGQTVGVIRLLLADYPALVSAKTNKGNTPRMLAEMYMEGGSERKRQVVALLEQKERQQEMRR